MEVERWQLKRIGTESSKDIHDLIKDEEYPMGRHRDNAIIIASLLVSRRHCRIQKDGSSLSITDNGSENGTFINKTRIATPNIPHTLKPGDLVGIGVPAHENATTFVFQVKHFPPSKVATSGHISNVPNPSHTEASTQNVPIVSLAIRGGKQANQSPDMHKETAKNTVNISIPISRTSTAVAPMQECQPSAIDVTKSKTWTQTSEATVVLSPRSATLVDKLPISKVPVLSESGSCFYGSWSAKIPNITVPDSSESVSPLPKLCPGKRKQVQEALKVDASGGSSAKRPCLESANSSLNGLADRVAPENDNIVQSAYKVSASKKQEKSSTISESCAIEMDSKDVECIEISDSDSEIIGVDAVKVEVEKEQDVRDVRKESGIHEAMVISHEINRLDGLSGNDRRSKPVKTERLEVVDEEMNRENCVVSKEKILPPILAPGVDQPLSLDPAITLIKPEPEDTKLMVCDGRDKILNDSFMDSIDRMASESDVKIEPLEQSQYSMQEIAYIVLTDDDDDDSIFPSSQLFNGSHSSLQHKQEPDMSDSDECAGKNIDDDVDDHESPSGFEGSVVEEEDEDSSDGWFEKLSQSKSNKNVPLKASKIEAIFNRADKSKQRECKKFSSDSDSNDDIIPRKCIRKKTPFKKIIWKPSSDSDSDEAFEAVSKPKESILCKDPASSVSKVCTVPAPSRSVPVEPSDSDSASHPFKTIALQGQKDLRKIQDNNRSYLKQLEKQKPVVIDALPLPSRRRRSRKSGTTEDTLPVKKDTSETRMANAKDNELIEQGKKRVEELQRKKIEEENEARLVEKQCVDQGMPVIIAKKRVSSVKSRHLKDTRNGIASKSDEDNSKNKKKKTESKSKADEPENQKILRNERLKEIAAKAKARKLREAAEADLGKKIYQKPSIKVTENNRGAFLVEDVTVSIPILPKSVKTLPKVPDLARIPKLRCSAPTLHGEPSAVHSRSAAMPKRSSTGEKPPVVSELSRRNSAPSTSVVDRDSVPSEPGTSRVESLSNGSAPPQKSNIRCHANTDVSCTQAPSTKNRKNCFAESSAPGLLKSCLKSLSFKGTERKKISWNDRKLCEIQMVDRYIGQMVPQPVGTVKDIPPPNVNRARNMYESCPNLYETVSDVCSWNTAWLTQQVANGPPPPVNNKNPLFPMLTQFSSYADYYKVIRPLMILDLWASIWKENKDNGRFEPLLICVDSVKCCKKYFPNTIFLDTVECHGLLSAEDSRLNRHPRVGDVVLFEYVLQKDETTGEPKQASLGVSNVAPIDASRVVRISFAYVIDSRKIPFDENSLDHIGLFAKVPNASFYVYLRLLTKKRECVICFHSITRLKFVSSIRSTLRSFEAIGCLEKSPLCKFILNPVEQDYSLPSVHPSEFLSYDELSTGRMNDLQMAAVLKTSKACLIGKPKISLIQGPPGTGKSLVIINLIFHILQSAASRKQKILFCAPSNAAVDEIVSRFLSVQATMEKHRPLKIVRVGNPERIDPALRKISLEELAKQRLRNQSDFENLDSVTLELNTLRAKATKVQLELDYARRNNRITATLSTKLANYEQIIKNITMGHGMAKSAYEKFVERRDAERHVIDEANVVAVTLASSVSSVMENLASYGSFQFNCCIVDEASQCSEPVCLLPLMQGIQTLVLVGDPKQLPATTHCQVAKKLGLDQSLLSRLSRCFTDASSNPIQLLTQQYRMHPEILRWPNSMFYENQLTTPLEVNRVSPLRPYTICHHDFKQSSGGFCNHKEAELVVSLVRCVLNVFMEHNMALNIGIITPYSKQRFMIRDMLKKVRLEEAVAVNTIDGYQGKERDVIIMSCVRTQGTGFMSDAHRLNVSLTRARFSMIICANFQSLEGNPMWRMLKEDGSIRSASFQLSPRHLQNGKTLESELLLF